jgi:hypothetical protein
MTATLERSHLAVDVLELSIAVRVRGAFASLAIHLQAIVQFAQQPRHSHVAHGVPLTLQLNRQVTRYAVFFL